MTKDSKHLVATFSIVGFDPETQELGIAVQSKFLGVGAVVPWAKAGVGAIATQSFANTSYGPKGLALLESGLSAQETLDKLVAEDEGRMMRQVGIVDAQGRAATFTGDACYEWAGGQTGPNYAAQGNILVGRETVEAMGQTFEQSQGSLAERLLQALEAGQRAGGDKRGQQSAALLVVKEKGGYAGFNDRAIDLRVDDHPEPIKELFRLYHLHQLYFNKPKPEDIVPIEGEIREGLLNGLRRLGYLKPEARDSDAELFQALTAFIHTENFEAREQERGKIDLAVYRYLLRKADA
ncbi:DUF1028 domain-containing protein [Caldalkalibacillus thermarum TA2.A1]|uniref:DUF1028 domain-containing protein n=1 Tax=Caldalkalibacillus thermarum (strain TA2.A1) TaxID=986075 RepID=A0A8X8IBL1_CALTT|nr:DUF1028 domain-containing protein [Caldalkalibacillus thermarum]QZT35521.1 DUF1028 domain-containing protein [Caldalkalibacillus thermarum TA2.A1]